MSPLLFHDRAQHLGSLQAAIQRASQPGPAVRQALRRSVSTLAIQDRVYKLEATSHIFLLAVGKASVSMLEAAEEILPHDIYQGIVVHRDPTFRSARPEIQSFFAGHPLPDQASLEAGGALAEMLGKTLPQDLVLCLVSGGTSAMLEYLPPGITLPELIDLTQRLLKCGAPIKAINTVRKALSMIKGGGLLSLAAPAQVASLILSDIVGDPLEDIGSGLTVPQAVSRSDARSILERLDLWEVTAPAIKGRLSAPPAASLKYPDPLNVVIASNRNLLLAASDAAEMLGFAVDLNEAPLEGEARDVGERIARRALSRRTGLHGPSAYIYGGETTVTVTGDGLGGRNQELALAAALVIDGQPGMSLMSFASDGVDGPTDAAGAIIDGGTCDRIRARGIDPGAALLQNDSYTALEAVSALIKIGSSGTNLNDVVVLLDYGPGKI
jgi:glycerate 2-kinase